MLLNVQLAVHQRGWAVLPISIHGAEDIERGFAAIALERAGAVIVLPDSFLAQQRHQISSLALNLSNFCDPELRAYGAFPT